MNEWMNEWMNESDEYCQLQVNEFVYDEISRDNVMTKFEIIIQSSYSIRWINRWIDKWMNHCTEWFIKTKRRHFTEKCQICEQSDPQIQLHCLQNRRKKYFI